MNDTPPLCAGAHYADLEISITRAEQANKLRHCDIDPDLYGDYGDITQLATDAILAANATGWSINGNVHVTQWFRPAGPIPLDTAITTTGVIKTLGPDPRGEIMTSSFEHRLPDGTVPLVSERDSLRLDAAKAAEKAAEKAKAKKSTAKPDVVDVESMVELGVKQLSPEKVLGYNGDGSNLIHSDPAVAKKFGYRAPIAGGLMGARMLLGRLVEETGLPLGLDIFVRFRRPMFWDDRLRLFGTRDEAGDLTEMILLNDADKINVEVRILRN